VSSPPRVAFFADSFHDVNGAALTCREFEAFARRRNYPFLSVHAGPQQRFEQQGEMRVLEMRRSKLSIALDTDLRFDPLLLLMRSEVVRQVRQFQPDIVHLTSPGDFGILGAIAADAVHVPLALAWHTNIHEFAARRVHNALRFLPSGFADRVSWNVEKIVLNFSLWFYGRGSVLFAPNQELIDLLHDGTAVPTVLMERGIDTNIFSPLHRTRTDDDFVMGFVGRLQPEKNVRLLAELEESLLKAGHTRFRFLLVGRGDERPWLEANLKQAEFTGVLSGKALSEAYANMDLFVFPSQTDTFGNVIQEAAASGVPSVVTNSGGPKFLVKHGVDGFVARNNEEFCSYAATVLADRALQKRFSIAARLKSLHNSWDRVFERVYEGYAQVLGRATVA